MDTLTAQQKRLRMRAWRRGTKEMDLILGPYADANLTAMDAEKLVEFEQLMEENDQDLYAWITGALPYSGPFSLFLQEISAFAMERLRAAR